MKNRQFTFAPCFFVSLFLLFTFSFFNSCNIENPDTEVDTTKEEWTYLFDGTGMDNWTAKFTGFPIGENYNNRFVFKDSLLSVRYELNDTFKQDFGHLFYKEKYSHYRLRATYRFVGEQMTNGPEWAFRNNGLMLHCQSPQSMTLDQDFPMCLEMQLLGGNGVDERATGNLCTPGTNVRMADTLFTDHCIQSSSKTYHGDQWVTVEALVLGDSLIQHIVEGQVVLTYTKPTADSRNVSTEDGTLPAAGTPVSEGYISIQAETHPIDFKTISLLNLCGCMDEKAKNYKSYFVKADNSLCIY